MQAIINRAIVSLRSKPSYASVLTDEVLYGMPVEILSTCASDDKEDNSQWCLIRTHYQYEGYCHLRDLFVKKWGSQETSITDCGHIKIITQAYADILDSPRFQGCCLQSIPRGGRIYVIGDGTTGDGSTSDGWIEVLLVNGRIGYTRRKYVGEYYDKPFTDNEATLREGLTATAKSYLGTQYRWGGKSPLGIDCSGLTSMCYMLCGVLIYRDADIRKGFPVKRIPNEEKKPGDLLYFPGHIAMYIGDELYIHSTGKEGSDGVVINSLCPTHPLYRADLHNSLKFTGSIF